jgi:hypothetical protein
MRTPPNVKLETLDIMAREYVALVEGDLGGPDGLEQYVHDLYGVSHNMLHIMQVHYGEAETSDAIDKVFNERKAHAKSPPVQG